MLVLRIKSGSEVMVKHRSGKTCFLRVNNFGSGYDHAGTFDIEDIQEGDAFDVMNAPPGDDLARFVLRHNQSGDVVRICIGDRNHSFIGGRMSGINVAFDDKAQNFQFFRPEVWKRKYFKMICGAKA